MKRVIILACALGVACGDDSGMNPDAGDDGGVDATTDAGRDTSMPDAPMPDATDAGPTCESGCDLVQIMAGGHACVRRENGEVLCWGGNLFGQLGDGRMGHQDCTDVGETERQDCSSRPVIVRDVVATQIENSSGPNTCALQADATVFCWGLSDLPPPGSDQRSREFDPVELEGFDAPTFVGTRNSNTCVITGGTDVECYGTNNSGQNGNGTFIEEATPVAVGTLTNVVELDVGIGETSCARNSEGVFCWGSNRYGQLGDGVDDHGETCGELPSTYDCSPAPVQVSVLTGGIPTAEAVQVDVGAQHACAVDSDGNLWCWGNNDAGQLGTGDNTGSSVPMQIDGVTGVAEVACGGLHTCVRYDDGSVQCWGANFEGQVGDGEEVGSHDRCSIGGGSEDCILSPADVSLPANALHLSASFGNSCAILDNNRVFCWGENFDRQLGTDDSRERSSTPLEILGFGFD